MIMDQWKECDMTPCGKKGLSLTARTTAKRRSHGRRQPTCWPREGGAWGGRTAAGRRCQSSADSWTCGPSRCQPGRRRLINNYAHRLLRWPEKGWADGGKLAAVDQH